MSDKALILRTCRPDMSSRNGFVWPGVGGVAVAPDWDPSPVCGGGLHGLLWGEGDGSLLGWSTDAVWLVAEVDAASIVDLDGKVKVPKATVVYAGGRAGATQYIHKHGGERKAIVGLHQTAGDGSHQTAGDDSHQTAGDDSHQTAGDDACQIAGDDACQIAGDRSSQTAGDCSHQTAGDDACQIAGDDACQIAGDRSTFTGGSGSVQICRYWDGRRWAVSVCVVGQDGCQPNTPYRCVQGVWTEVRE